MLEQQRATLCEGLVLRDANGENRRRTEDIFGLPRVGMGRATSVAASGRAGRRGTAQDLVRASEASGLAGRGTRRHYLGKGGGSSVDRLTESSG